MRHLAILTVAVMATACATATATAPADSEFQLVRAKTGKAASFAAALKDAGDAKVVYLGEQHNNDFHHEFQFEMVKAMYRQDPNLLIGMEMFQRPYQSSLDDFIAGNIDEVEMLQQTEYFTRWGWDYHYYRPILLFAKKNGVPVIALNATKEVSRKVARGGLESLNEEERAVIASEINLDVEAHRAYVQSVWDRHPMDSIMTFENFYAAQCVWEDTMAESAANSVAAHPGSRMAVIVGAGHVRQRFGIPVRADARGAAPSIVFYAMTRRMEEAIPELIEKDYADWFLVTADAPRTPPTPKLGFMPDMARMKDGVFVSKVTSGTLAGLAGVKAGDQIVEMAGYETRSLADLKLALAMGTKRRGNIVVLRDGKRVTLPYDMRWIGR